MKKSRKLRLSLIDVSVLFDLFFGKVGLIPAIPSLHVDSCPVIWLRVPMVAWFGYPPLYMEPLVGTQFPQL